ncbi:predicted protein [Histoplasma capsulatum H143]|uniref:Uncharacterized protein n=1 Tax=Ajellomyces capsulatus (strain H143) TaxID=544712 RepID=C6HF85_AJECH|nr:predicted protein [Histoplasma capsulatum H143]
MPHFAGGAVRGCCSLYYSIAGSMPLVSQSLFLKMRCQCAQSRIQRRNDDGYTALQRQVHYSSFSELEDMRDFNHRPLWCSIQIMSHVSNLKSSHWLSLCPILKSSQKVVQQGNVQSPLKAKHESLQ